LPTLGGHGIALLQLDRVEQAIPYLLEAAEHLHPYRSLFKTLLAAGYGFLGKADEAPTTMGSSLRLKPQDDVFIDFVRDGSLRKRLSEGFRLAGIALEPA
jgi:Flp pilus assembly protein TadD